MITSKFLAAKTVDYGVSLMQSEHHDFHKHSYGFAALATKELFLFGCKIPPGERPTS